MATLSKTALVRDIAASLGFSQTAVNDVIQSLTDLVQEKTADGETVSLAGFGRFSMRERAARQARNPRTGETIDVPATRVLTFKPSKSKD